MKDSDSDAKNKKVQKVRPYLSSSSASSSDVEGENTSNKRYSALLKNGFKKLKLLDRKIEPWEHGFVSSPPPKIKIEKYCKGFLEQKHPQQHNKNCPIQVDEFQNGHTTNNMPRLLEKTHMLEFENKPTCGNTILFPTPNFCPTSLPKKKESMMTPKFTTLEPSQVLKLSVLGSLSKKPLFEDDQKVIEQELLKAQNKDTHNYEDPNNENKKNHDIFLVPQLGQEFQKVHDLDEKVPKKRNELLKMFNNLHDIKSMGNVNQEGYLGYKKVILGAQKSDNHRIEDLVKENQTCGECLLRPSKEDPRDVAVSPRDPEKESERNKMLKTLQDLRNVESSSNQYEEANVDGPVEILQNIKSFGNYGQEANPRYKEISRFIC
jgi:hypothetical protein